MVPWGRSYIIYLGTEGEKLTVKNHFATPTIVCSLTSGTKLGLHVINSEGNSSKLFYPSSLVGDFVPYTVIRLLKHREWRPLVLILCGKIESRPCSLSPLTSIPK